MKLLKRHNYNFEIIMLNVISVIVLISQFLIKRANTFAAIFCVSLVLLSIIYFIVNCINRVIGWLEYKSFKYETQNLNMMVFNNKWDQNPSYDCLTYISKDLRYNKNELDNLLSKSRSFNEVNAFELYQKLIESLYVFSTFELKNMYSFLNIKFDKGSSNIFHSDLFVTIFLFMLTTVFGIDVHNGKVDLSSSYLYRIFKLTNDLSIRIFSIYVLFVVILFVLLTWVVRRKQRRTVLITIEAIKRVLESRNVNLN